MAVIIPWILGALASMGIAMLVEWLRMPRLAIVAEDPPFQGQYLPQAPAQVARFLRVNVTNRRLRWIARNAALQCEAEVTFFHLDGQRVFARSMPGRWVDSPEPPQPAMVGTVGGQPVTLYNPGLLNVMAWQLRRIDVYAGRSRLLDIAARFDEEAECYGWTNANYFSNPQWRNPDWRLLAGRYLVKVKVDADAAIKSRTFRLINDTTLASFRIEPTLPNDPAV